MPLIDTRRFQPDSLDTLALADLDGQAAPGRNAWTAASGTFSVVASPSPEYTGQQSLRAISTPTGTARLKVQNFSALLNKFEFGVDVFLRSTWATGSIQYISVSDNSVDYIVRILIRATASNYEIRWVDDATTQVSVLPKATYDDKMVSLRLIVDTTAATHTAFIDGAIAEDTFADKMINEPVYWIVASSTVPANIDRFLWSQVTTASIDIRNIYLKYADPIIIEPHDGDLTGISHEIWLYLDDDLHTYSTKAYRDSGGTFDNRIISISAITSELGSEYGGASNSAVTCRLSNRTERGTLPSSADLEMSRLFDNLGGNEWFGRKGEIYVRRLTADGDIDRVLLFTGLLSALNVSGGTCTVTLAPRSAERFGTVQPLEITSGIFPNAAANSIGRHIPIVAGDPSHTPPTGKPGAVPAFAIDTTAKKVAVAAHETVSGDAFNLWYYDGDNWALVPGSAIVTRTHNDTGYVGTITTITLQDVGFTFDATYQWASDVTGILDSSSATITSPIEAMRGVATTFADLDGSDFGDTVFTAETALENQSLTIANVIAEPIDFKTWLNDFLSAYDLDIYFDREGKIALSWFEPSVQTPTVYTDLSDIYGMPTVRYSTQTGTGRRSIYNRIFTRYGFVAPVNEWSATAQKDDFTSQAGLGRTIRVERDNLFINAAGQISKVDAHRLEYRARPLQIVSATLSTRLIVPTFPTHVIGLTHFAGLNADGGGWSEEPFYVESVSYDPMTFRVGIVAVRYLDWLQDAYILIDEAGIEVIANGGGSSITLTSASATISGFSNAEIAAMSVGNIIQIKTALNPITAFIASIDTGLNEIDIEDTDGSPVTANANESTTAYVVKPAWTQLSAVNQGYGGLARKIARTSTGTVATTAGSNVLTGTATTFVTDSVAVGDEIKVRGSNPMQAFVKAVNSETEIIMNANAPASGSTISYTIYEGGAKIGTKPGKRL